MRVLKRKILFVLFGQIWMSSYSLLSSVTFNLNLWLISGDLAPGDTLLFEHCFRRILMPMCSQQSKREDWENLTDEFHNETNTGCFLSDAFSPQVTFASAIVAASVCLVAAFICYDPARIAKTLTIWFTSESDCSCSFKKNGPCKYKSPSMHYWVHLVAYSLFCLVDWWGRRIQRVIVHISMGFDSGMF